MFVGKRWAEPRKIYAGLPRIDWSNPITNGLCFANVPGCGPGDLVSGTMPIVGSNFSCSKINERGLGGGAANGLTTGNTTYLQYPQSLLPFNGSNTQFTFFFYGQAQNISTDQGLMSTSNPGSFSSVLDVVKIFNGTLRFEDTSGSIVSLSAVTAGQIFTAAISAIAGVSRQVWFNGVLETTSATVAASYSTGQQWEAWKHDTHDTSWSGIGMEMLAWRRALSPAEHASLATDATQFLIWPEDDILAQMFGSGSLISVLPGDAYGTSAYGRRAWGLPPLVAGGVNSFIWRDNSLGNQPSRNPHEMIPY